MVMVTMVIFGSVFLNVNKMTQVGFNLFSNPCQEIFGLPAYDKFPFSILE